ncbi:plasma-membrane choline transporter-domain-containing protein [Naematelia encephala]|uniref:Protein PNS1 n=1 Tax=Naematelia encephala TaxID=71784 RepID=A0A1Y2BI58_9TREE|nr:plasma-membrane choline transporter-domain-containing protein [Naematelia encephala]
MSNPQRDQGAGPSAFSAYASKFLAGKVAGRNPGIQGSQIFRPPSPSSPSHDPFMTSPTASQSHPYLPGSSRSPSPSSRTPPFPGPGIDGIPDIDDGLGGLSSSLGVGVLFGQSEDNVSPPPTKGKDGTKSTIPNPYAASSESDGELEANLDEVATIRRSLLKKPVSERARKGWLAHQSIFPPSSSSSSETESDKETEAETEDEEAHSTMMGRSRHKLRSHSREVDQDDDQEDYMLSPSELYNATVKQHVSAGADLNEPLLGPDEVDERGELGKVPARLQVYHGRFGHWEREGLRKYKDSTFLALWLSSLLGVFIGLLFVWGSTDPPPDGSNVSAPSVVPLLPLLIVLLIPSLVLPPAFLLLLRKTVRPVLLGTAILIPFSLFICGWWAFAASFETSGLDGNDPSDRWWGTTGLRLCAGALWLLAACFGRLVWVRRKRLERTAAVVELSTHLLLTHPPLLLLTPLLLGVFAITSIPFLTLLVRLGTIGYWRHPRENTYVFHLRPYAGWLIFLVTLIWVWTWGVIRGVGRVAVAAVVGEWYFHRDEPTHPAALEISTAAVHRATGTSLGSVCLGAGIVATVRVVGRSAAEMKRITSPKSKILPSPLSFLSNLAPVFAVIAGVLDQLNGYALVYVGITGEAFWPSARRAVGLAGKRKGGRLLDYTLIKLLLTLSSTTMGLFTATAGYLYMTHSLGNPGYAPVAALLCGGLPFLAIRACASVLGDAADSLFICHQIDREIGGGHCEKAKEAFEGELPRRLSAV